MPRLNWLYLLVPLLAACTMAQQNSNHNKAIPEMAKLAQALSGDWNNQEILEPVGQFPKGA
jgi:hypothetical protein